MLLGSFDFLSSTTAIDILDTFFDPVMIIDKDLNMIFINDSLMRTIGKNAKSYIGRNFFEIVKTGDFEDKDKSADCDSVWAMMKKSGGGTVRQGVIKLGDFDVAVMITITPVVRHDRVDGYILLLRDMRSVNDLTKALKMTQTKMQEMLKKDALTGLYNRRYFNQKVIDYYENANQRIINGFAYIMFDIDHFKRVNDQYGHDAGDTVLRIMGSISKTYFEQWEGDAFRYGGEEFVAILSKVEATDVFDIAEGFRKEVETNTLYPFDLKITISIGVTYYTLSYLSKVRSVNNLMMIVDDALYDAKKCGRNRVKEVSLLTDYPLLGIV